jgi:hypothetical protein
LKRTDTVLLSSSTKMTLLPVTNDRYATLRAKQHSSDFSMLVNSVLIGVGAINIGRIRFSLHRWAKERGI